jgi:hypothetical protein
MTKIMMGRDEIQKVLQDNGFAPNPAGLVDHVDGEQDEQHIWFDINADAVRHRDVVPDYPIRILFKKVPGQMRGERQLVSVKELSATDKTVALKRQLDTKISPWPEKNKSK